MPVGADLLAALREVDTPTICNALELVAPDRRNGGFTTRPFVSAFPGMPPIVGYARTATVRAFGRSDKDASELKALRLAYYEHVAASSGVPTVSIIEDLDDQPGHGAFWGEVNTAVHRGLGVLGCVTSGSIRDLDALAPGFQLLAGSIGPSHAFVRIEAFGAPVTVHGLTIAPGDLVHADRHGAVVIPEEVAALVPDAVKLCMRREAPILAAARAPGFTLAKLVQAMGEADDIH